MLESAVLIVNKNGQLSACPTRADFESHPYVTENMVRFDIEASVLILQMLRLAGRTVWLAGEGLPIPEPQEGRIYLIVCQGRLWPSKKVKKRRLKAV